MSSTEDDEPPAKKTKAEAKKAKMVAPPEEWNDFLELDEYPQPPGHVRAVPCPPWLTWPHPQDAKFHTDLKGILRPYHTYKSDYKSDVLPMSGTYFLKRHTRKFTKNQGERMPEEIRLFDEVKCAYPTTTRWMVISITGTPFEESRRRCAPIAPAPNSNLLFSQGSGGCCTDSQQQWQTVVGRMNQHPR